MWGDIDVMDQPKYLLWAWQIDGPLGTSKESGFVHVRGLQQGIRAVWYELNLQTNPTCTPTTWKGTR